MPGTRARILRMRDSLSEGERIRRSISIVERLKGLDAFSDATMPMLYCSFRSEADTWQLIRQRLSSGLPVIVPRTDTVSKRLYPYRIFDWERDLKKGAYGILEPDPASSTPVNPLSIDFVLVPGSVFDLSCGRYGYGGGYYDRFLANDAPAATRGAIAFDFQVMERIPLAPHDQRMHFVITETRIIACSGITSSNRQNGSGMAG